MQDSERIRKELTETLTRLKNSCEEKRSLMEATDYEDLVVYIDSSLFYLELNQFEECKKEISYAIDLIRRYKEGTEGDSI